MGERDDGVGVGVGVRVRVVVTGLDLGVEVGVESYLVKETTQIIQQHTKWEIVVGGAGAARLAWQRQQLGNTHRGAGQQVVHVGQQPLVGGAAAHSGRGERRGEEEVLL